MSRIEIAANRTVRTTGAPAPRCTTAMDRQTGGRQTGREAVYKNPANPLAATPHRRYSAASPLRSGDVGEWL